MALYLLPPLPRGSEGAREHQKRHLTRPSWNSPVPLTTTTIGHEGFQPDCSGASVDTGEE